MKWNDAYLFLMDADDWMLLKSANDLKEKYQIPDEKCYSTLPAQGFTTKERNFLKQATVYSKIIIVSHGNGGEVIAKRGDQIGGYIPQRFCHFLVTVMGLKQAGILSFKGCSIGSSTYIEELREHLDRNKVKIGWLSAYKKGCSPYGASFSVGLYDEFRLCISPLITLQKHNESRVNIIKGNTEIFPLHGTSARFKTI
jgi:hypothetical protein